MAQTRFHHPLEFISADRRRLLFIFFTILAVLMSGIFQFLDKPLQTAEAPFGIVSFELAGSVERVQAMVNSWDAQALLTGAFGLGFDFLFMPIYATALSLAGLLASTRRKGRWETLGKSLGWGAILASGFDACENIFLFTILQGHNYFPIPELAAWCAATKFGLIICVVIYGLVGWFLPAK